MNSSNVDVSRFRSWSAKDLSTSWVETLRGAAAILKKWRSCCHFPSSQCSGKCFYSKAVFCVMAIAVLSLFATCGSTSYPPRIFVVSKAAGNSREKTLPNRVHVAVLR